MGEQNEEYESPRLFDIRGIELKEGKHDELCIAQHDELCIAGGP